MARIVKRLSAVMVSKVTAKGMYPDGNGLYLQVGPTGAKSWILRFRAGGKRHDMGLGPFPLVSLAEAREKTDAARRERLGGRNPLEARRQEQRLKAATAITFQEAASQYIAAHEVEWKNEKHRWQWRQTLESFAFPIIGGLPVAAVDTTHVLKILEPIWLDKNETASRLRGRIEKILDWARVRGFREGDNTARWKGHLDHLLPQPSKVQKKEHYPSLPYAELPAFMALLREKEGFSALALRFQILTAGRSGEILGAHWQEFDLDAALWTIPGEKMKMNREHRVPLSSAAMDILKAMKQGERVFKLSDMALTTLIRRMHADELKQGRKGFLDPKMNKVAVPHGFRSTLKDWASENTSFSREVTEMALAHAIEDKVEAAYRRGDLFEKRRELMATWAEYCLQRHHSK